MRIKPTDRSEPVNTPSKHRIQNVVEAFLSHSNDREKRLAAIEKALEMNAKARQEEREKASLESCEENERLCSPIDGTMNARLSEDQAKRSSLLEQLRKQAKETSRYKSKGLNWLINRK